MSPTTNNELSNQPINCPNVNVDGDHVVEAVVVHDGVAPVHRILGTHSKKQDSDTHGPTVVDHDKIALVGGMDGNHSMLVLVVAGVDLEETRSIPVEAGRHGIPEEMMPWLQDDPLQRDAM
jgi:hypothetical protein